MRWGLMPSWVKDPRKFTLLINARSETVREKPAFKNAIKRRRCLIPADGYYEWQDASGRKRPFFIHRRDGQSGRLCRARGNLDGAERRGDRQRRHRHRAGQPRSRRAASPRARDDRAEEFERWLDGRAYDADDVMPLLRGPAEGEFAWHEISTRVNRVVNDDAQLLLPITDEERAAEEPKPAKKAAPRKATAASEDDGQGSLF